MKRITTYLLLVAVILAAASICGCSDEEEFDVIGDLKDTVWEEYGSQTLEKAANSTLSNVKWLYDDTPSFDEGTGFCYNVSLKGEFKDDGTSITIDFKVLYKYRQMKDDPADIVATVESVTYGDEVYNDIESISVLFDMLYGNV